MAEPFKFGPANLYLTEVWVELPSDSEAALLLKPLTHATLSKTQELAYLKQNNNDYFKHETIQSILASSIIDTRNIIDFPSYTTLVEQLPKKDLEYLYERLMEISSITNTQLENIGDMLSIQFHPQFRDDSWNCQTCQEKKLDYSRGCGYLPETERDKSPRLPRINGKRYDTCPMSTLDGYVLRQASMAHSMLDAGILPEAGGIGDQTEWFVRSAFLYKRKIAEAERAMMDEHKKK